MVCNLQCYAKGEHRPLNVDSSTAPSIEHCPLILNIWSWNVNGHFDTNLSHPDFSKLFDGIDVFFIQETHYYADGDNVPTPPGFTLYSYARACSDLAHPWGGVATFVRSHLNPHVRDDFSRLDLLTIEVNGTLLMNTYVLPHRSRLNWRDWTNIDPWLFLLSKIHLANEQGLPLILLGDLNACTGFSQASPNHPTCISLDSKQPDKLTTHHLRNIVVHPSNYPSQLTSITSLTKSYTLNPPPLKMNVTKSMVSLLYIQLHTLLFLSMLLASVKNASQPNAVTGSGVFFRDGNAFNLSKRVPGDQSHDHAVLYAVLLTLQVAPPFCPIDIHTSSDYPIVASIAACSAPISFFKINFDPCNHHHTKVNSLAAAACDLPLPLPGGHDDLTSIPTGPIFIPPPTCPTQPKIHTNLPKPLPSKHLPTTSAQDAATFSCANAWGHTLRHCLQTAMRNRILEASVSPAAFWKLYKKLQYPSLPPPQVSLNDLLNCFTPRLNPPDPNSS
ncbi:hypothetical protein D9758_010234 [Tetrapyrgos nigripes]|uniref:Endonuclease/exonuclease/phosphatase domain-containing protein n=1 Tax=Tetrapyrgos nigripes TaxID=182062 RepID=A0A8H5FV34_9AGAR|nr:hypothetical protein D9758_010234 [Tetrapyrgos nigripes]